MEVNKIWYPSDLSVISDIKNDNIDVFVELEDGITYTLVFATPENLIYLMDKEKMDFLEGCPFVVIRLITDEIIRKTIYSYASGDAYWIKYYHLAGEVNIKEINRLCVDVRTERMETK